MLKPSSLKIQLDNPLVVFPVIAKTIGLNESIIIGQVHYWLSQKEKKDDEVIDGRYWIYNTYNERALQFPFWSINTIKRTISYLEGRGILLSSDKYNTDPANRTKWYTIDYEILAGLLALSQNDTMDTDHSTKLSHSSDPNGATLYNEQRLHSETTQEKEKNIKKEKEDINGDKVSSPNEPPPTSKKSLKANKVSTTPEAPRLSKENFKDKVKEFKGQYDVELLKEFYLYWSEEDTRGKQRWQKEPTFDVSRRLARWLSNIKQRRREKEERQQQRAAITKQIAFNSSQKNHGQTFTKQLTNLDIGSVAKKVSRGNAGNGEDDNDLYGD